MSEKFNVVKKNINLNWVKAISGLVMVIGSVVAYKFKKNKSKYVAPVAAVTGVLGVTLLATELESNFKPIDIEEEEQ